MVRMPSPQRSDLSPLKVNASRSADIFLRRSISVSPNFNCLMSTVPIDSEAMMPALKVIEVMLQKKR
jgi:hypothetical protein